MGYNWLHKHRAPLHVYVLADSDAARTPHRFILQHVSPKQTSNRAMDNEIEK